MRPHIYIVSILALLFIVIFAPSCSNEPIRLDAAEKTMADTLAEKEIKTLTVNYDVWCKNNHDALVLRWTDSLVKFQIQAIEAKLKKSVPPVKPN
jgi:hypothetical protein